jgi:hypothetical protein
MSERSDEREELARALRDANWVGRGCGEAPMPWSQCSQDTKNGYLAAAGVAIARCARVPAEVWDVIDHMRETPIGRAFAESLEAALKSAERPAEPSPRITREHYDAAYQRAVDASVRGEATVKEALCRELGVGEPAPRALPTRDQLSAEVVSLLQRHGASSGLFPHAVVDRLTALLREHPSPADEALRAQLRSAKAASDELEAMLETAERERDWAQSAMRQAIAVLDLKDADADPKCDDAWWLVEGCKGVADALKDLHAHIAVVERERDALRQELAEVTGQAEQVEGDLALLRRERDEARAQLEEANAANDRDFALVQEECRELRSKLAARPEPVVIDEALAERVCEELLRRHGSYGTKEGVLAALRSVLGEKVSVAAPRTDDQRAYELLSDECGVLINECRDHRAELDKLRAELQAAQEERDRHEGANILNRNALRLLREQHEALRALVAVHDSDKDLPGSINMVWYGNRVHDGARALLKPATPEAPPMPADTDRISWVNASPADALRPNDRHAQRPASEMPRPASLAPLTARVERLEAALRHFLSCRGWWREGADEALAMLDAGKQEVG